MAGNQFSVLSSQPVGPLPDRTTIPLNLTTENRNRELRTAFRDKVLDLRRGALVFLGHAAQPSFTAALPASQSG